MTKQKQTPSIEQQALAIEEATPGTVSLVRGEYQPTGFPIETTESGLLSIEIPSPESGGSQRFIAKDLAGLVQKLAVAQWHATKLLRRMSHENTKQQEYVSGEFYTVAGFSKKDMSSKQRQVFEESLELREQQRRARQIMQRSNQ